MFSKPPSTCSKSPRDAGERPREARGPSSTRTRTRRRGLAAVSVALIVALVALPTASALASADSSRPGGTGTAKRPALSAGQLVTPGQLLSAGELQKLLSALPLGDLSATQLAHYLAALEGVSVLSELKLGLLSSKELGVVGLEESLRKAIEQLGPSATLGELVEVENFLPELTNALEGKLGDLGLLNLLLGELPGGGSAGLEGALGSLDLEQLVGSLLKATTPHEQLANELAGLAGGLFGELGAEHTLEGLLGGSEGGSELTGGFAAESVKEVAEHLNTTPVAVSEELGQTAAQLPESTTMLTAPLKDGKLAGVAPAVKGLLTGVLGNLGETPEGKGEEEGGKGGSGEGGGEGSGEGTGTGEGKGSGSGEGGKGSGSGEGKGGSGEGKGGGGQGGTGSGGSTTVLLTMPATSPAAPATKQTTGGVSILSHRVRGHVATLVLRVPAAGTVRLAGRGVHGASRQAARAERLTLRASLSHAASASLRRHHRLVVRLNATFHPTSGSNSSATARVIFG